MKKIFMLLAILSLSANAMELNQSAAEQADALITAISAHDTNSVAKLLKEGINPNIPNECQNTALSTAAIEGYTDIVALLLKAGANPNMPDETYLSPLMRIMMAKPAHEIEIMKLLLKGDANTNVQDVNGWTPLMIACDSGNKDMVKLLLDYAADPNSQKKDGFSALMIAAKHGYADIAEMLLMAGADPNLQDEKGFTALMEASSGNHTNKKMVALLLQYGAQVNLKTHIGNTALIIAAIWANKSIVKMLLKAGANVNAQNNAGDTALMVMYKIFKERSIGFSFTLAEAQDALAVTQLILKYASAGKLFWENNKYQNLFPSGLKEEVHARTASTLDLTLKNNKGQTTLQIAQSLLHDPRLENIQDEVKQIVTLLENAQSQLAQSQHSMEKKE